MPDISYLLRRFRRLGTAPGPPATGIGVPERPGEALGLELQAVFTAVDAAELEADALRAQGALDAERRLAVAQVESARIRDEGLRHAAIEGAEVADARARASADAVARIAAEADREASRVIEAARSREAGLVSKAIDRTFWP